MPPGKANLGQMGVGGRRRGVRTVREGRAAGVPLHRISSRRLVGSWLAIIAEGHKFLIDVSVLSEARFYKSVKSGELLFARSIEPLKVAAQFAADALRRPVAARKR
jgi:hypothetical protein